MLSSRVTVTHLTTIIINHTGYYFALILQYHKIVVISQFAPASPEGAELYKLNVSKQFHALIVD